MIGFINSAPAGISAATAFTQSHDINLVLHEG